MKSIIQELQFEATKQNGSTTELLRKAKIVSSKLNLEEFLGWINEELNGYATADYKNIPDYRLIKGEPRGWNPYHGWISVMFNDVESQETLSKMPISQPIGQLEELYNSESDDLQVSYGAKAQQVIGEAVGFQTKFALMIGKSAVAGILDSVRNIILDWSIKLEKEGILGDGISFSKEDQKKAHEPSTIIKINKIDNFIGNVGNLADSASVNISNITQNEINKIRDLVEQVNKNIDGVNLKNEDKSRVDEEIKFIELEIAKTEPQKSIINKSFNSIKTILEGASGNIIAQGILYSIGKMLS